MEKEKEFNPLEKQTNIELKKEWKEYESYLEDLVNNKISGWIVKKSEELSEDDFNVLYDEYDKTMNDFINSFKNINDKNDYLAWHVISGSTPEYELSLKLDFLEPYNVKNFLLKVMDKFKIEEESNKEWEDYSHYIWSLNYKIISWISQKEQELNKDEYGILFKKYIDMRRIFINEVNSLNKNKEIGNIDDYIAWHLFKGSSGMDIKKVPKLDFPESHSVKNFLLKMIDELGMEIEK